MTPGECPHELSLVEMGRSRKTLCDVRGREIWTTCRDWGRCTLAPDGDAAGSRPRACGSGADGEVRGMGQGRLF